MSAEDFPSVTLAVALGVLLALVLSLLIGVWAPHPSLRDIGEPCRDHGGVAQYIAGTKFPFDHELPTVVCRDGKVGRVG